MELGDMPSVGDDVLSDPVKPAKINKLPKKKKQKQKTIAADTTTSNADQTTMPSAVQPEQPSHKATLHKHLHKTRFCMYHLQGACQFGAECSFAHSLAEMSQTPDLRKTQLCKQYAEGQCNDENCTFAHGDDELRSTEMFFKRTLCIWNEKGKCRNGARCRFAHGMKELRQMQNQDTDQMKSGLKELCQGLPGAEQRNARSQSGVKDWGKGKGSHSNGAPELPMGNFVGSAPELPMGLPMKISPGNFASPGNFMQSEEAALHQLMRADEATLRQLVPQHPASSHNSSNSGSNLNAELSQLCQSISILSEQCSNIQKRMELEAEFNNIQRSIETVTKASHRFAMPDAAPMYQGYPAQIPCMGQQAPYPPRADLFPYQNVPRVNGCMDPNIQMTSGLVGALQAAMASLEFSQQRAQAMKGPHDT